MNNKKQIVILGGGPTGLGLAYFFRKANISFELFEAADRVGGNAKTFQCGDFLFDSGAHRFHDKDPEITQEIKSLLGHQLKVVNIRSHIYFRDKKINFPITPLNILSKLKASDILKIAQDLAVLMFKRKGTAKSFEDFIHTVYGPTLSDLFIKPYCEKLWGIPANRLSTVIAGGRMQGLTFLTLFKEIFLGPNKKSEHLDGSFYYPEKGIGEISNCLAEFAGRERIHTHSQITRLFHSGKQITEIEINHEQRIKFAAVFSTLPLNMILKLMIPCPPDNILFLAQSLRFRSLCLVVLFLDKESVTQSGTVYFPDSDTLFTRAYEPKMRSPAMAPPDKTSLVVEIPFSEEDSVAKWSDKILIENVVSNLEAMKWIRSAEVLGSKVIRFKYAYPVLEIGSEERVRELMAYLKDFTNLKLCGRNSEFCYASIHHMLQSAKTSIEHYLLKHSSSEV